MSSIQQGPIIDYIGMKIDISSKTYVEISMDKYIDSILAKLKIAGISRVPANAQLFQIDKTSKLLTDELKQLSHTIVASLLYLSLRVRPDLLVSVTLLYSLSIRNH